MKSNSAQVRLIVLAPEQHIRRSLGVRVLSALCSDPSELKKSIPHQCEIQAVYATKALEQ